MRTIAEMQQELRKLRKELQSIDTQLGELDEELTNYKDVAKDTSKYKRIFEIAQIMPLIKHPIINQSATVKNSYFGILLMVATLDDSINENQLLFLQRIAMGDENNQKIDHFLGNLGSMQPENILYKIDETVKDEYADQLILDMLLIANLSRGTTKKSFEMIANIAALFGKSKNDLNYICLVAVAILNQQIKGLPSEFKVMLKIEAKYGYYLEDVPGWKELLGAIKDNTALMKKELQERLIEVLQKYAQNRRSKLKLRRQQIQNKI